jgi:hypothetical protein
VLGSNLREGLPETGVGGAKMRRIILLLTVALVMGAMMVAMALPAAALEPSAGLGQSSCVGHEASTLAIASGVEFGEFASGLAGPMAGQ